MATCCNAYCLNFVRNEGDQCYKCFSGLTTYKPTSFEIAPISLPKYCSKPGCFNTVSNYGDVCCSCNMPTYNPPTPSYTPYSSYSSSSDDDDVDELFDRAKAAYRREQDREQARIRRNKDYAYDWVQAVIGFLQLILQVFSALWGKCCFLSTAVTRHLGLSDDCYYLQVLRRFRDEYVFASGNPDRIADIKRYYDIAPEVVRWIDSQSDADDIWRDLTGTIIDCVTAIESGHFERAYQMYKTRVLAFEEFISSVVRT